MAHAEASHPADGDFGLARTAGNRTARGMLNGCILGLCCWAGLLWLAFG